MIKPLRARRLLVIVAATLIGGGLLACSSTEEPKQTQRPKDAPKIEREAETKSGLETERVIAESEKGVRPVPKTRLVVGDAMLFVDLIRREYQHARLLDASGTQIARKQSGADGLIEFDLNGVTLVAGDKYTIENEANGYSLSLTCHVSGKEEIAWSEQLIYPSAKGQEFVLRGARLAKSGTVKVVSASAIIECEVLSRSETTIRARLPLDSKPPYGFVTIRVAYAHDPGDYAVGFANFK